MVEPTTPDIRPQQPEEGTETTELDPTKIDERILAYNVTEARKRGTMPDGWMMSYHKNEATIEDIQSPEWDQNVILYTKKLREMAKELDALLASGQIQQTRENQIAANTTRTALLLEADMYYSLVEKRPAVSLTAFFHPESQTKKALSVLEEKSNEEKQRVISGRMQAIDTELSTLFGFIQDGGWQISSEKDRFCGMLKNMLPAQNQAAQESYREMWVSAGGSDESFTDHWNQFAATIERYIKKFESIEVPEKPKILGESHIQNYFDTIGVTVEIPQLIEYCDGYATKLREEIRKIQKENPDIPEKSFPKDNAEILEKAQQAADHYIQWCRDQGIVPQDFTLPDGLFQIKTAASVGELSIASIDPKGEKISFQHAAAEDIWSTNWSSIAAITRHEITHYIQMQRKDGFPMSSLAQEGAAVASEWLQPEDVTAEQQIALFQAELRRVMRVKMGMEFHTDQKTVEQLMGDAKEQALITTEYQTSNVVGMGITNFKLVADYLAGSLLMKALAHKKYGGDIKKAMQEVGKNGFRLPGHAFIEDATMNGFSLLEHLQSS